MPRNNNSVWLLCLSLFLWVVPAQAQTTGCSRLYVDSSIVTSGNGSSWATAFKTLTLALDNANSGSCTSREIWVAKGTYRPMASATVVASNRDSSFRVLQNGIKLYGGFAGTETVLSARNVAANPTVLSGDIGIANDSTDNCYHVVTVVSSSTIDTNTRIDGFTIRKGNANVFGTFYTTGKFLNQSNGGGVYNSYSSPAILNCTFVSGNAIGGGGVYNESSAAELTGCTFTANTGTAGGGLYNESSSPRISNCTFSSNTGSNYAGGMYNNASSAALSNCTFSANTSGSHGGGMYNNASSPAIKNCTFSLNSSGSGSSGGGMYNGGASAPAVTSCTFSLNSSAYSGGGVHNDYSAPSFTNCVFSANTSSISGGGINNYYSSPSIINCLFVSNTSDFGGGVRNDFSSADIINCTFFANSASSNGGGVYNNGFASPAIKNCIVWGNISNSGGGGGIFTSGTTNAPVSYTINQTPQSGTGNSSADPLFVNPANPKGFDGIWGTSDDGLLLLDCSPAINTGNSAALPPGVTTDITGGVRILSNAVDRGAYEMPATYNGTSVTTVSRSPAGPVCNNTAITFTANTPTPGSMPIYQWYRNGVAVGTNSTTYTFSSWSNGDSVWVVHANNTCSVSDTSLKQIIQLAPVPAQPGAITGNFSPCPGSQVYSVIAVTGAADYTWTVPAGWTITAGQGTTAITVTTTATAGNITVVANNICGAASAVRSLTITSLAAPAVPAGPATVCASSTGNSYSIPAVSGATTYTWTVPAGWTITAGQGTTVITVTAAAGTTSGTIGVDASNGCQTSSSAPLAVTGNTVVPTLIVGSNSGSSICAGTLVTFTAAPVNSGTSPSYQWKKNGVNVGTNSTTYSTTTLATGDVVSVVLTSNTPCTTGFSVTALGPPITVVPVAAPAITVNGMQNLILCTGNTYTFTSSSTDGGPNPTYQWYKNGVAIPGATSFSYTGAGFATNDSFSVVLTSNAACRLADTARSPAVKLTVYPNGAPTVSISSSAGNSICLGTPVTYTAVATNGGPAPVYQWKRNGVNVGTNSATYSSSTLANGDVISIVFTSNSPCTTVFTATATLPALTVVPTVMPAISINGAQNIVLCSGSANTFTITSSNGGPNPVYQWYKNGVAIAGATGTSYTSSTFANNDSVSVLLTSNATCRLADTVRSNSVKLTVYPNMAPTLIVGSNSGSSICVGTLVTYTATQINGGSTSSYQWKKNGVNVGTNSPIYSTSTLVTGDVVSVVLASNSPCVAASTLTASGPPITVVSSVVPAISINGPSGLTLCEGTSLTFTSGSSNAGTNPAYQWYRNGTPIPGATGSSYTGSTFANNDSVWVALLSSVACRTADTVRSVGVKLLVNPNIVPAVTVTASPGLSVPAGTSVTFTANVTAGATNANYQWYKNGTAIAGATGSTYTTTTLKGGDLISVGVANLGPCASPASLTSAQVRISDPAGINTVSGGSGGWQASLLLHPNPNSGRFTISADWGAIAAGEKVQVEVVNALGQSVFRTEVLVREAKWHLDIQLNESLANGLYLLRLQRQSDGSRLARPVVIER